MDIAALVGILIGLGGVLLGYAMEGGAFGALIQVTSASIVFGGTIGATLLAFPIHDLQKLPIAFKTVFTIKKHDEVAIINQLVDLSEKARRDGLLSLEQDRDNIEDGIFKKGLGLVVDGVEAAALKDILDRENELRESISEVGAKIFEAAGGFSPTMGVLGTVMGMVNILGNMGGDTAELAHSIAVAFIATMYGVMFANLFYLPFASRIKAKNERDRMVNDIIIEGLLSIQAGENPRIIKEKLNLSLMEKLQGKSSGAQDQKQNAEG